MTLENIIAIVGILGIGTIIGAYFQSRFQHSQSLKKDLHEFKRARYGSIMIQMLSLLDPLNNLKKLMNIRQDIKSEEELKQELEFERLNAVLFASDGVMKSLSEFIKNPSSQTYLRVAISMRKDLWGSDTKISEDDIPF